jgi:hypothetical protein
MLLGGVFCALSGFRNTVVRYMITTLVGMYATVRWGAFLILPLAVAAALLMAATQGTVFNYPLALQRGLFTRKLGCESCNRGWRLQRLAETDERAVL